MRIESLELEHFGTWTTLRLKNLTEGVNVFFGPNEVGKTTLMQFIRTIFYGFAPGRLQYLSRPAPCQTGGRVKLVTRSGVTTLERFAVDYEEDAPYSPVRFSNTELPNYAQTSYVRRFATRHVLDGLSIRDGQGASQESALLLDLLESRDDHPVRLDETLFNSIFAMGLRELQQLAVLDSTEAARRLYELSTGIERHAISAILDTLQTSRERILAPEDVWDRLGGPSGPGELTLGGSHSGLLPRLLAHRNSLAEKLRKVQKQAEQYSRLEQERAKVTRQITRFEADFAQAEHRRNVFGLADDLRDLWTERESQDEAIVAFLETHPALGGMSAAELEIPATVLPQLTSLGAEKARLLARRRELATEMRTLKQELAQPRPGADLAGNRAAIEALLQQQEWIGTLQNRLAELRRMRLDTEAQITVDYRRLGLPEPVFGEDPMPNAGGTSVGGTSVGGTSVGGTSVGGTSGTSEFPYDSATLRTLRTPMREIGKIQKTFSTERDKYRSLTAQADVCRAGLEEYSERCAARVKASPIPRDIPALRGFPQDFCESAGEGAEPQTAQTAPSTLDPQRVSRAFGEVVAQYRRDELNLEQWDKMEASRAEIAAEIQRESARLQPSVRLLVGLGAVFVLALTVSLFEALRLFDVAPTASHPRSLFLFLIGTLVWLGCVAFKMVRERLIRRALETLAERERSVAAQVDRLRQACGMEGQAETQPQLREERRLQAARFRQFAQSEIAFAEEAALLVSNREALLSEARHLRARLGNLRTQLTAAQERRAAALAAVGLPKTWGGAQVRQLSDEADRLRELWRRRARDIEDYRLYRNDLARFAERAEGILAAVEGRDWSDCRVAPGAARQDGNSFPYRDTLFATLRAEVQRCDETAARRAQKRRKMAELRRDWEACRSAYGKNVAKSKRLLERAGCADLAGLERRCDAIRQLDALRKRRRELQESIDAQRNFLCDESVLWEVYRQYPAARMESKRRELANACDELELQLSALRKRLEEAEASSQALLRDDSGIQTAFELRQTDARIRYAVQAWRASGMAARLLETVRKTYQQRRQPQTLDAASVYLREMTAGKYARVWTPVDEDILFVERKDGAAFSSDQLSTGTRELLYLALRLALIAEYRDRGVDVPVILDDVLVNFDRSRAEAAADLLCRFAGDRTQLLFFTGHEHIREIFAAHDVTICDMG